MTKIKNDPTYEYMPKSSRPRMEQSELTLSSCTRQVLDNELKKRVDGFLYHTTDTNEFFYDWKGKRYSLNWIGGGASEAEIKKSLADAIAAIKKNTADIAKLDPAKAAKASADAADAKAVATAAKTTADAAKATADGLAAQIGAAATASDNAVAAANAAASKADAASAKADGFATDIAGAVADAADAKAAANTATAAVAGKADKTYVDSTFAKSSDIPSVEGLASKSWVEGKGYLTSHQSLSDYAKTADIEAAYAKKNEIPSLDCYAKTADLTDYAKKSEIPAEKTFKTVNGESIIGTGNISIQVDNVDLTGYAKTADIETAYAKKNEIPTDYLVESDLADYAKSADIPTDYLVESDLAGYAKTADLPSVVEGEFPDDITSSDAAVSGFATVDGVMAYVNALVEDLKKNEPVASSADYLYITGSPVGGDIADIATYVPYEIEVDEDNKYVVEVVSPREMEGYPDHYKMITFGVDVPEGYTLVSIEQWSEVISKYVAADYTANPRNATKVYGDKTYNCYSRVPGDGDWEGEAVLDSGFKYKITITK